jgi:hypothetical protein
MPSCQEIMAHLYAYIYGDKRSKEFAHVDNLVDTGAAKIRRDAEWITYHCGIEGESAGHARTFKDAKHRARQMRWDLPIGKTTRIVTKKNGEGEPLDVVRFVEFEDEPHVYDGRGVIGIDRIEAFVRDKYPNARWAGDCVCKHTYDGGHSDHADCAAVDYFASWEVMGKMKNEFISNSDYYHTKYCILADRLYYPGGGSAYYSGPYHTHLHTSVYGGIYNSAC